MAPTGAGWWLSDDVRALTTTAQAVRRAVGGAHSFDWLLRFISVAALCAVVLPAPLLASNLGWAPGVELLPLAAGASLALGLLLASLGLSGLLAHPLAVGTGALAVVLIAGGVPVDASALAAEATDLWQRLAASFEAVAGGGICRDPLLFPASMVAGVWLIGYASAWHTVRTRAPWVALASNGLMLVLELNDAPAVPAAGYAAPLVGGVLTLLVTRQVATRRALWRRAALPSEPAVGQRMLLAGGVASGTLLLVAWAMPPGGVQPRVAAAWHSVVLRAQEPLRVTDRLFGAVNSQPGGRGLDFGRTVQPGGAPGLSGAPVLRIQSDQPHYWRATSADQYTGWTFTSTSASTSAVHDANDDLVGDDQRLAEEREDRSTVEVLAARSGVVFVPGLPLRLSIASRVEARADSSDLAVIRPAVPLERSQTYEVVSLSTDATVQDLRRAGERYPDWVKQRYLQLPRRYAPRVRELASEMVGHDTVAPFDKAVALEAYLRATYGYVADVPPLEADHDWVETFLFDRKEGYADDFAATLVVMLRTQGVPARLASGFTRGEQDSDTTWLIRESDAHSWVEVFIPRYGWIVFEPSPDQPLPQRKEAAPEPVPTAPPPSTPVQPYQQPPLNAQEQAELEKLAGETAQQPAGISSNGAWLIALAVLAFMGAASGLGLVALRYFWRRGLGSLAAYQRSYAEMLRLASWTGVVRPHPSTTPYELRERLVQIVPALATTIARVTDVFVEGTYSPRGSSSPPSATWHEERRVLLRAFLARRIDAMGRGVRSLGSRTPRVRRPPTQPPGAERDD